ncbi:hypothetical protein HY969_04845 [Candidatus Kaiserbacteria bacterium]|nr:hypothetical protein [Candidatus Kaiserbacteria bacterium]
MPDRDDGQKEIIRTDSREESVQKDSSKTDINLFLGGELRTNPFGHNVSGDHVYRRAERIAAAVHLLTAHLPSSEPVRSHVREESMNLLAVALLLKDELRAPGSEVFKQAQGSVRKLISMTRLLGVSGFVSLQNTQTVVDALDELGALLLTSQRSSLSESIDLSREDLMPRRMILTEETLVLERRSRKHRAPKKGAVIKDRPIKDTRASSDTLGMRGERILDILRSGGNLGIKDIASNLPEYSEKMIQRELVALVATGKVFKSGAKRWSRYSVTR